MFFSQHFLLALFVCFCRNLYRAFLSPFFGQDIRVNIKNVFSHFLRLFFSQHFLLAIFRVFLEKLFRAFFPTIFTSRYSCEYKKRVFALLDDFFPNIFCLHYSCVSVEICIARFSHHFLVRIFV